MARGRGSALPADGLRVALWMAGASACRWRPVRRERRDDGGCILAERTDDPGRCRRRAERSVATRPSQSDRDPMERSKALVAERSSRFSAHPSVPLAVAHRGGLVDKEVTCDDCFRSAPPPSPPSGASYPAPPGSSARSRKPSIPFDLQAFAHHDSLEARACLRARRPSSRRHCPRNHQHPEP